MSRGFWVTAAVAGINSLVSAGFAIGTLAGGSSSTGWYSADRTAVLLAATAVVAARRNRAGLVVLGWMLAAVQAADAVVGLSTGSISNTIGPAVVAIATAIACHRLSKEPAPTVAPGLPSVAGTT